MSEDKKSLIDLVPDSVDNAIKNITDKPTQNMGTTFADIWYLVFGGISQAAEKRKLKYSYALQEFENELKEKILKIPEDKLVEPDIQVIAQALESSKYCVEKEELRHMFSSLISNCLNKDYSDKIHPIFTQIIKSLSPLDAQMLLNFYNKSNDFDFKIDLTDIQSLKGSFDVLVQLGLIKCEYNQSNNNITNKDNLKEHLLQSLDYKGKMSMELKLMDLKNEQTNTIIFSNKIYFTPLGMNFMSVCSF